MHNLQRKTLQTRWITVALAVFAASIIAAITIIAAIYFPEIAVYVPIITIALAMAMQKYIASFSAYFIITFSRIYDIGDRIRIENQKGDVRKIGLLHTTLEEVGEDEKLGGELTGRLLHIPNLIVLDHPILNYSKDYSTQYTTIYSDYMFDEVRIPLSTNSDIKRATEILENVLNKNDAIYVNDAGRVFQDDYPRFLDEVKSGPRIQIYIEPHQIWIQGKFVAPLRDRNDLRSQIFMEFLDKVSNVPDIKLS